MRQTLIVGDVPVGVFIVSDDPDPQLREAQNLVLALIAIPRALSDFHPTGPMSPEDRYTAVLSGICRLIMGRDDEVTVSEVRQRFESEGGPDAYLWLQVRRASGSMQCMCGKAYYRHPSETRLVENGATRLCNGDLVHL